MRRLYVAIPAVLLMGVAAAWGYLRDDTDAAARLATAIVARGDIEETVTALGTLQPLEYVDVGAQVSGQLRRIHVAIGDQVRQGELLAEIDPRIYPGAGRGRPRHAAKPAGAARGAAGTAHARQEPVRAADRSSQGQGHQPRGLRERRGHAEGDRGPDRRAERPDRACQAPIILRIADLESMTVRTQVSEADVNRLTPGMDVYFTTLGQPERRWSGKLRQILPSPEVVNNVVLYNAIFDVRTANERHEEKRSVRPASRRACHRRPDYA